MEREKRQLFVRELRRSDRGGPSRKPLLYRVNCQNRSAIRIFGSPFKIFDEAEAACDAMLKHLTVKIKKPSGTVRPWPSRAIGRPSTKAARSFAASRHSDKAGLSSPRQSWLFLGCTEREHRDFENSQKHVHISQSAPPFDVDQAGAEPQIVLLGACETSLRSLQ
jgi:hypothetical protein